MNPIHKFVKRKFAIHSVEYKLLCTKEWETFISGEKPLTVDAKITCHKCLDILIPKKQAELDAMKERRSKDP